jgi:putative tryptophan/tyrosine transport system substrate-binding protein
MRRREFIAALGGATVAWPLTAGAQQPVRIRRIAVLMSFAESDAHGVANLSELARGLRELGWIDGRNVQMEVRWWGSGDIARIQILVKELVDMRPDVIVSHGTPVTAAFHRETRKIPIVFVSPADPVGDGFVASLPHPGGNLTGFIFTEGAIAGKWLELLVEIAPRIRRAAIMFNPDTAPGHGSFYLPFFEATARSLKLEPITVPVHSDSDIKTNTGSLGRKPGGGLVAMGDPFMLAHRAPMISAAARNSVPAISFNAVFPRDGGLLSYGPDLGDMFHRAASYVDRILHGSKPAELPVQVPEKFELVINKKTAKALGLDVPTDLLAIANEVIE